MLLSKVAIMVDNKLICILKNIYLYEHILKICQHTWSLTDDVIAKRSRPFKTKRNSNSHKCTACLSVTANKLDVKINFDLLHKMK